MVDVLVGGDVCPVGRNMPYFLAGDAELLLGDLFSEFADAHLTIVNLECPLIEREMPLVKCGPVLGVQSGCVLGLKNAHIDVVSLANNHILDHGEQGLTNTIGLCQDAGLGILGAGRNLDEAGRALSCQIDGLCLGVLSYAEHEFSIAGRDSAGANPLCLMEYVRWMRQHRDEHDCVIVLLHAGKEHYRYPSPELQRVCRFLVEEGAGIVVCQHSHCVGCYETHADGHILYGQGNLLFDGGDRAPQSWREGCLVKISVQRRRPLKMDIIPFVQSHAGPGVRRMTTRQEEAFMREFRARSARIADECFVQTQWSQLCRELKPFYFSALRGHNRFMRRMNRLTCFCDLFYSKRQMPMLANIIRCETHREVLQTILSDAAGLEMLVGSDSKPVDCDNRPC